MRYFEKVSMKIIKTWTRMILSVLGRNFEMGWSAVHFKTNELDCRTAWSQIMNDQAT